MMEEAEGRRAAEIEDVFLRLRLPDLHKDTIALLVARLIELRFPNKRLEFASDSEIVITSADGGRGSMYFENLWAECAQTPEDRAEIVERYVRVLVPDESDAPTDKLSLENVVALVRDDVYFTFLKVEDRPTVTRHLIADLWIILAVDLPDTTTTISAQSAMDLHHDSAELMQVAIANVGELLSEMSFEPYGECFTISCGHISYASSALLLPHVWEQATRLVIGEVVVAVPARDTVLFTGSGNAQGLKEIREAADYVIKTGHHTISTTLLRWAEGAWVLLS